jgi:hypothetical protein
MMLQRVISEIVVRRLRRRYHWKMQNLPLYILSIFLTLNSSMAQEPLKSDSASMSGVCSSDFKKLCGDIKEGQFQCLEKNLNELSPPCKNLIGSKNSKRDQRMMERLKARKGARKVRKQHTEPKVVPSAAATSQQQ